MGARSANGISIHSVYLLTLFLGSSCGVHRSLVYHRANARDRSIMKLNSFEISLTLSSLDYQIMSMFARIAQCQSLEVKTKILSLNAEELTANDVSLKMRQVFVL